MPPPLSVSDLLSVRLSHIAQKFSFTVCCEYVLHFLNKLLKAKINSLKKNNVYSTSTAQNQNKQNRFLLVVWLAKTFFKFEQQKFCLTQIDSPYRKLYNLINCPFFNFFIMHVFTSSLLQVSVFVKFVMFWNVFK